MAWGAVIGAVASIAGSALSSRKSSSGGSRYRFRPQDAGNADGYTGVARFGDGRLNLVGTPFDNDARQSYQDLFNLSMTDDVLGLRPAGLEAVNYGQANLGNAVSDAFGPDFARSEAALAPFLQASGQGMGLLGAGGVAGIGSAFGGPSTGRFADSSFGQAQSLFNQAGNQGDLVANTKAQLDALSRPQEEQLANAKFQNLFSTGRLGTTGGAQAMAELQRSLSQADTARAVQAQQLGMQNQQGLLGLGQQFLGQGSAATSADQQYAINQGQLGSSLMDQYAGLNAGMLGAINAADATQISRGRERLGDLQGMFGFGQNLFEQPGAMGARSLEGMDIINNRLLDLGRLSVSASGVASGTNTNVPSGSPIGSALSGLGAGLFNNYLSNSSSSGGGGFTSPGMSWSPQGAQDFFRAPPGK